MDTFFDRFNFFLLLFWLNVLLIILFYLYFCFHLRLSIVDIEFYISLLFLEVSKKKVEVKFCSWIKIMKLR